MNAQLARVSGGIQEARATTLAELALTGAEVTSRIQAARNESIADIDRSFAEQKTTLIQRGNAALAQLTQAKAAERQRLHGAAQRERTKLQTELTERQAAARTLTASTIQAVSRHGEQEAARAVEHARANQARVRSFASSRAGDGEAPLAEALNGATRQITDKAVEACGKSGAEISRRARRDATEVVTRIRDHQQPYLDSLQHSARQALSELDQTEREALTELDHVLVAREQSVRRDLARATADLEQRKGQARGQVDQLASSATQRVRTADNELRTEVQEHVGRAHAALERERVQLHEVFSSAGGVSDEALETARAGVAERTQAAHDQCLDGMAQIRAKVSSQLIPLGEGFAQDARAAVAACTEDLHRSGETWLTSIEQHVSEARGKLREGVDGLVRRMTAATASWRTTAGGARARFEDDLAHARAEALRGITANVDEGLAGQDEKVAEVDAKIGSAHQRLRGEYDRLKGQARAQGGAPTHRSFLGSVWDFFSDLATSTLEWFQQTLGDFWGSIVGGILAGIIYVFGALAVAVCWIVAQVINLVWGFIWGEVAIDVPGGFVFMLIGDIVAGILVYGDLRDIFKHVILKWIRGEEITWVDWTIAGISLVSAILTLVGVGVLLDFVKGIFKAGLKSAAKTVLKELAKELGEELAERFLREVGEEAAERLLRELGGPLLRQLIEEFGERGVKELVEALGERAVKELSAELGAATLKQLWDALGKETLKTLTEKLGARGVKELTAAFTVAGIKELSETFTAATLKELVTSFTSAGLKKAWDALGKAAFSGLVTEFGPAALKTAWDEIGEAGFKVLATDLTAPAIKALYDDLGGVALHHLSDGLTGQQLFDLLRSHGLDAGFFRRLGEVAGSGRSLAGALRHFGTAADLSQVLAKAFTSGMPEGILKTFLDECVTHGYKKLPDLMTFFDKVVADGAGAWLKAMQGGSNFVADSVGNLIEYGGRTAASSAPVATRALTLSDGSHMLLSLDPHDILHTASRHTWEFFKMTFGNVKLQNSMWPLDTTQGTIGTLMQEALNGSALQTAVRAMAPGATGEVSVTVGGMAAKVFVDLRAPQGIISLYPGAGVGMDMPKELMKAAVSLWKSL